MVSTRQAPPAATAPTPVTVMSVSMPPVNAGAVPRPQAVRFLTLFFGSEKALAAISATDPTIAFALFKRPDGDWTCSCLAWQRSGGQCAHVAAARAQKRRPR
jgi:hypothetical protein